MIARRNIMRIKNIIGLCASYLLLIVAMFVSSIDQAKGGLQVTGSLVLLIVFAFVLIALYTPFIVVSIFERRGSSIAVLAFSIFMEIAIMLPLLLNSIFSHTPFGLSKGIMLIFVPINMVVLLFLIVVNSVFLAKNKR